METFHKYLVGTLIALSFFGESMAAMEKKKEVQKSTYIVWYESSLKSVSASAEMLYTYDTAIHGLSTRLIEEEARLLESQSGILAVLPEMRHELLTTRIPEFLGLDKEAEFFPDSNTPDEVIIGVLDTGVWPESENFDETGLGPIPSNWKGKCEPGTNFTKKTIVFNSG